MPITNVQLGTGTTDLTTASSGETRAVLAIIFCNTTAATRTISVYAIPSGSSANASTTILSSLAIPANDSYIWTANEKFILGQGDKVSALCDVATSVTATVTFYNL